LWSVIGATLFIMFGFGLIVPALPQFVKEFKGGDASVAAVLFAFSLTRLTGNFFASGLIERFGERQMAAAGATIVGLSSLAAGRATSYAALLVLRGLGGFGSAFFLGALTAYLIGTIPSVERGRAMSMFQGSIGLGLLFGPLFGGLIVDHISVNAPLYIYGAVCLVFAPLALRTMREPHVNEDGLAHAPDLAEEHPPAPMRPSWTRLRPLLSSSAYRAALGVSAITFVLVSAPQALIVRYWTDTLHYSKATSGVPFLIEGAAGLLIIWHAGALSDRRGRKVVLVPAMAVCTIAAVALGYSHSGLTVLVWIGVLGMASGYTRPGPTAIVADVAPPGSRAVAVAGYRIAGDVGAVAGPVIAGVLAKFGGFTAAWIGVGVCCLAVFVMVVRADETLPARTRG
jgi:MFS family permease